MKGCMIYLIKILISMYLCKTEIYQMKVLRFVMAFSTWHPLSYPPGDKKHVLVIRIRYMDLILDMASVKTIFRISSNTDDIHSENSWKRCVRIFFHCILTEVGG